MSRYTVEPPWVNIDTIGPIEVEQANLRDHKGFVFDGAYRVRNAGKLIKTFKGESAWSDAERLATDLYFDWRLTR